MKNLLTAISFLSLTLTYGQADWNWPEDQEMFSKAQERQAFYKVSMQLENWDDAWSSLHWLYQNNDNLHQSIYIDGVKVIEELIPTSEDRITQLQDSLLWMFDKRLEYFGNEGKVVDRKAYAAFKLYYKVPNKYPLLAELYENAFKLNGNELSTFNITPYMTLARYYYLNDKEKMPADQVLEVHGRLSGIIESKGATGTEKVDRLQKEQDKIDALLTSIEGIVSCEFIASQLVPKLESEPGNLNVAKKIFRYSLQAKCTEENYFLLASEVVFNNQPSAELAATLANKYASQEQYSEALTFFEKSFELTEDDLGKYNARLAQANLHMKMGNKIESRKYANLALAIVPNDTKIFNLLGNLYFTSFEQCKKEESKVLDRAVFIAAYDQYTKANNQEQMAAAKAQFPSIEEIFSEGYEEGDEVEVSCWVGGKVKLQRRD